MGKFGSELSDFIKEALDHGDYSESLICIDKKSYTFRLSLPRLSKSTIVSDRVNILKDWNSKKGRNLTTMEDFSNAKQGLKMALKKSRYIDKISIDKTSLNYRIRTDKEVNAIIKRKRSKFPKNKRWSVSSSGYGSIESPCDANSQCFSGCDEPISGDSPENGWEEMLLEDALAVSAVVKSGAEFEKLWKEIENWVDQNPDDKSSDQNVDNSLYITDYNYPMCSTADLPEEDCEEMTLTDDAIAGYDPAAEFEKMWEENVTQMGCLDQNVGENSKVIPLFEINEIMTESGEIWVQCVPSSEELKADIPIGAAFLSNILGVVGNKDLLNLLEFYYVKHINLLNGGLQLFLSLRNSTEEHAEYTKQYLGRGEGYILCGTDHFIYCCNG